MLPEPHVTIAAFLGCLGLLQMVVIGVLVTDPDDLVTDPDVATPCDVRQRAATDAVLLCLKMVHEMRSLTHSPDVPDPRAMDVFASLKAPPTTAT